MDFALMTEPQLGGSYEQLLAAARWAEQAGLVSFARSDHFYAGREPRPDATDAFATLAGLARETERIRLCVLVTPITFRHPAVIAKTAVTIDRMAGGRLDLGVGTGWMELEHEAFGLPFPPWRERFDRLEEALRYLRAALGDEPARFEGDYYRLDAEVRPKPAAPLPIIVGGQGPQRTPQLAAAYANEYNHFVAPAAEIGPKISRMREAAIAAGRDPAGVTCSVMGPALVGNDDAGYRRRLEAAAAARDQAPEELEERWAGHGIPLGPPPRARETLAALAEVGVSKFYLQHLDLADLSTLDDTLAALAG